MVLRERKELKECNSEVFNYGTHIATIFDLKQGQLEAIVHAASESSGQRIDWYSMGNSANIKALGDIPSAIESLKSELKIYDPRHYRFN